MTNEIQRIARFWWGSARPSLPCYAGCFADLQGRRAGEAIQHAFGAYILVDIRPVKPLTIAENRGTFVAALG